MVDSAECWLNTTSKVSLYHQGNIYIYLPPVKDALGLRMPGVYSKWMNVTRFILDKVVDLFKLESKTHTISTDRQISGSGKQHQPVPYY